MAVGKRSVPFRISITRDVGKLLLMSGTEPSKSENTEDKRGREGGREGARKGGREGGTEIADGGQGASHG